MANIPGKSNFINYDFRNFENLAQVSRGWDADFLQLDCGAFRAQLIQLMSANRFVYLQPI